MLAQVTVWATEHRYCLITSIRCADFGVKKLGCVFSTAFFDWKQNLNISMVHYTQSLFLSGFVWRRGNVTINLWRDCHVSNISGRG